MGAVGVKTTSGSSLVNQPSAEAEKYTEFDDHGGADKWFANEKLSNFSEWRTGLSDAEYKALKSYTGGGYSSMNSSLYGIPWDEMSATQKAKMAALYDAISRFELKKGINVTRKADFQIFGAKDTYSQMTVDQIKDFLKQTNGVVQNDGFMSFSADPRGRGINGNSVVIHLRIPPSKGAGAYVNPISSNMGEMEYVLNTNAVLKFDTNSVEKKSDGKIHVTADWLGQAQMQTIDPKNKSVHAKKKS